MHLATWLVSLPENHEVPGSTPPASSKAQACRMEACDSHACYELRRSPPCTGVHLLGPRVTMDAAYKVLGDSLTPAWLRGVLLSPGSLVSSLSTTRNY